MVYTHDRGVAITLILVAAVLMYSGVNLPRETIIFPVVVLSAIIALSTILLFRKVREGSGVGHIFINSKLFIVAVGTMAVYIAIVPRLGFFTSTIVYVPVTSFLLGSRSIKSVFISTAIFVSVLYSVFKLIFKAPLPQEFLIPILKSLTSQLIY